MCVDVWRKDLYGCFFKGFENCFELIVTPFKTQWAKKLIKCGLFSKYLFHPETFRAQRVACKTDKTLIILACFSTKLTFCVQAENAQS